MATMDKVSLMRRCCRTVLLLALLAAAPCTVSGAASPPQQPPAPSVASSQEADFPDTVDPELIKAEAQWLREAETALLAQQLASLLKQTDAGAEAESGTEEGGGRWREPALLFDTAVADAAEQSASNEIHDYPAGAWSVGKRSRYYRRYPWKRQPGRGGGSSGGAGMTMAEIDNPYMCNPTREDVFRLLAALHEARAGNLGRTVSFCNRRRPAAAVFTNIRFLGRRRR